MTGTGFKRERCVHDRDRLQADERSLVTGTGFKRVSVYS